MAAAYGIPYLDLAAGIDAGNEGRLDVAGGRLCVMMPEAACLYCMDEIDPAEAHFFLGTEEERAFQVARGYVRGMNVKAPAVVSLNAALAALAVNEFAVLVSGVRPVNQYTELDLLGRGRPLASQWATPRGVTVTLDAKPAGERRTGDPFAPFDRAGAGDGLCMSTAPAHDPTAVARAPAS